MSEANADQRGNARDPQRIVYVTSEGAAGSQDLDLRELVRRLWAGKFLIAAIALAGAVLALVASLFQPTLFQSSALLAPVEEEQGSGLGRLTERFGGLASMAGVNLPATAGPSRTTIALETMKSRVFLVGFVRRHDLAVPLMAAEGWDPEAGWVIDAELYDPASERWIAGGEEGGAPTDWELYLAMSDVLTVEEDVDTGLVTVTVELRSPPAAAQWGQWLVEDLNGYMRSREIEEADRSVRYLREQAESTALAEMKSVFFRLIEAQIQQRMLARVREEFVFRTIDPFSVPQVRSSPNRTLMVAAGGMLGLLIGLVIALVRGRNRGDART